jgi:hypothetical protein
MFSYFPQEDAMRTAEQLKEEHPGATVGYHELSAATGASAWMALAFLPDGQTMTRVFTDGDTASAMREAARRTGELVRQRAERMARRHAADADA